MFEAAGARPYPPRSVYLRGIEESQIFIGIYKEGYGFIAEAMDISGLEDEYRYAMSWGLPQLLYVKRDADMDARLRAFVDSFTTPDRTVSYYDDLSKLADQIRKDLAALVAEYFRRGQALPGIGPPDPAAVAEGLVPTPRRLRRVDLEQAFIGHIASNAFTQVTGTIGAGKTVFLSTLAADQRWAFTQCGDKSPAEVLSDAANSVRSFLGLPAKGYLQLHEAQAALKAAWQAQSSATLILDDVRSTALVELIQTTVSVGADHRLVISSREALVTSATPFALPPLELGEIRDLVSMSRHAALLPGELDELQRLSHGNPLYLRYYLTSQPGAFEQTLSGYELKVWNHLPSNARELLSYLAWATRPLRLEELAELYTGRLGPVEEVAEALSSAGSLLIESSRGYSFFHPHAIQTIRDAIRASSGRVAFYTKRLSKWFAKRHDYAAAFNALDLAGLSVP